LSPFPDPSTHEFLFSVGFTLKLYAIKLHKPQCFRGSLCKPGGHLSPGGCTGVPFHRAFSWVALLFVKRSTLSPPRFLIDSSGPSTFSSYGLNTLRLPFAPGQSSRVQPLVSKVSPLIIPMVSLQVGFPALNGGKPWSFSWSLLVPCLFEGLAFRHDFSNQITLGVLPSNHPPVQSPATQIVFTSDLNMSVQFPVLVFSQSTSLCRWLEVKDN